MCDRHHEAAVSLRPALTCVQVVAAGLLLACLIIAPRAPFLELGFKLDWWQGNARKSVFSSNPRLMAREGSRGRAFTIGRHVEEEVRSRDDRGSCKAAAETSP